MELMLEQLTEINGWFDMYIQVLSESLQTETVTKEEFTELHDRAVVVYKEINERA